MLNAATKKPTIWNGSEIPALGTCCTTVCVCVWYHSLTAHQHQKGHTVQKQVIMISMLHYGTEAQDTEEILCGIHYCQRTRPLLSYKPAEQTRLITLHEKNIERVLGVSNTLMVEYQDLFDGRLRTLPVTHALQVDATKKQVVMQS